MNAIRLLSMTRKKRLESVEWHIKWQEGLEKESFFNEVFNEGINNDKL